MADAFAASLVGVTDLSGEFTTAMPTSGSRKSMFLYNASHSSSGEIYVGQAGMGAATKFPIPKGVVVELPLTDNLDTYFEAESGEAGELYILEIS